MGSRKPTCYKQTSHIVYCPNSNTLRRKRAIALTTGGNPNCVGNPALVAGLWLGVSPPPGVVLLRG